MLFQALLLGIACLQVLEGYARAQLVGGNDPRIRRQAEQMGLLRVDDGFGAGNVGLECAHLRRLQSEPQSQLALAQRGLRFFQVRDVDDRADRAHGPPAIGRIAVVPPPLNGHPTHGPVGPHNSMQAAPFSFIGRVASRFQARGHGRLIARIEQPRRLRISQLRSCRQTQDGAQLGGEPSSVVLEIACRKCRYRRPGLPGAAAHRSRLAPKLGERLRWRVRLRPLSGAPGSASCCSVPFAAEAPAPVSTRWQCAQLSIAELRDPARRPCPREVQPTSIGENPSRGHLVRRGSLGPCCGQRTVSMLRPAHRRLRRKQRRRKRRQFYGKGARA